MKRLIEKYKNDRLIRFWLPLFLALIAGGLVDDAFTTFFYFFEQNNTPEYEQPSAKIPSSYIYLHTIGDIYNDMNYLKHSINSQKILIIKSHNSGSPIFNKSTIIAETFNEKYNVHLDWQSRPLDQEYIQMLQNLVVNHKLLINTDEISDSMLRDVYLANGVMYSDIRLIGGNNTEIYFMSIHLGEKERNVLNYENTVNSGISKIRNKLENIGVIH